MPIRIWLFKDAIGDPFHDLALEEKGDDKDGNGGENGNSDRNDEKARSHRGLLRVFVKRVEKNVMRVGDIILSVQIAIRR